MDDGHCAVLVVADDVEPKNQHATIGFDPAHVPSFESRHPKQGSQKEKVR
jgi:hypothetical protein